MVFFQHQHGQNKCVLCENFLAIKTNSDSGNIGKVMAYPTYLMLGRNCGRALPDTSLSLPMMPGGKRIRGKSKYEPGIRPGGGISISAG